jgi:DNA repair photolyase
LSIKKQRFENGIVAQFLRRRVPIHFGGMSDPFQPAERRWRVTQAALKILAEYNYPTVISTRGEMVAEPEYLALLRDVGRVVVQFSFSTTRDDVAARIEPYATRPSVLLRVMEKLNHASIHTTCRWQPYIPGISEAPEEFVSVLVRTGTRHISMEHLKLPVERRPATLRVLNHAAGTDFWEAYRRSGAYRDGRELVLPCERKAAIVREARTIVHRFGLSFGAADNEFQHLSDFDCCCSGVDQFEGFHNWFRHQIGYAIKKSKGRNIRYKSIEHEWCPTGAINRYLNSKSRLVDSAATIKDLIRERWNDVKHPTGPAAFYGVRPTDRRDPSGMVVYERELES